jgi:hypothetical protein
MIMIINKLALLPNPRQEVFHTRRMAFRGIDPVPDVDRPGLVRRPAGTHGQLTAVALDRTHHFDAAGRFIHPRSRCGRDLRARHRRNPARWAARHLVLRRLQAAVITLRARGA